MCAAPDAGKRLIPVLLDRLKIRDGGIGIGLEQGPYFLDESFPKNGYKEGGVIGRHLLDEGVCGVGFLPSRSSEGRRVWLKEGKPSNTNKEGIDEKAIL